MKADIVVEVELEAEGVDESEGGDFYVGLKPRVTIRPANLRTDPGEIEAAVRQFARKTGGKLKVGRLNIGF